jgi:hypothetical protein
MDRCRTDIPPLLSLAGPGHRQAACWLQDGGVAAPPELAAADTGDGRAPQPPAAADSRGGGVPQPDAATDTGDGAAPRAAAAPVPAADLGSQR